MFDKDIMAMLGKDKIHLVFVVLLETIEECLSLAFSAFLCLALKDALEGSQDVSRYALFLGLAAGMAVIRFFISLLEGNEKDRLGGKAKKSLRYQLYNKAITLGLTRNRNDVISHEYLPK